MHFHNNGCPERGAGDKKGEQMEKKIHIPLLAIIAGLIFIELFDRTFIFSSKTAPVFSDWGLSFRSLQFRRLYRVSFANSDTTL